MSQGGGGLPVLTYHAIGPERSPLATDPGRFADTLAALLDSGHRPVDLDDWVARGRPDVPRGFALAFDDGLQSMLTVAELLGRHAVPATVFLVTGRVGTDNAWPGQPRWVPVEPALGWPEVAALSSLGLRFASHGATHAGLDRLDAARLDHELRSSRAAIEERTGRASGLLAYPYGRSTPAVRRAASRHYAAAFGTALGLADGGQDRCDLARIDAYYLRNARVLSALIDGRARGWIRWRRALRAVRRAAC
jgi:peptidoglycan/xylan/chitin deacetylase (PgdA/CDA1 family)